MFTLNRKDPDIIEEGTDVPTPDELANPSWPY